MTNIKNLAIGVGLTTLATFLTSPSIDNCFGGNYSIYDTQLTGIHASYDEEEDEEDHSSAEKKKYMTYQPTAIDDSIDFRDAEIWKHLYNESPSAFEDKYIREYAERFGREFELHNLEYEAKCYKTGIGFGDYLFTEGFCFLSDPDNIEYCYHIVKATRDEFDEYLKEMKKYNRVTHVSEHPENGLLCYALDDDVCSEYVVCYHIDTEVLVEERFFDH